MTFREGSSDNKNLKIQNDHSSRQISGTIRYFSNHLPVPDVTLELKGDIVKPMTLDWKIRIEQQDSWWKLINREMMSGVLPPGENVRIPIEVNRSNLKPGTYKGNFYVSGQGEGYFREEQVTLTMLIGSKATDLGHGVPDQLTLEPDECTTSLNPSSDAADFRLVNQRTRKINDASSLQQLDASNYIVISRTDSGGDYVFDQLQKGNNYRVWPSKTGDCSGFTISVYDAFLTAQIASDQMSDISDFNRTAADVNRDGSVSSLDVTMIAHRAVGLPAVPSSDVGQWTFDPSHRSFTPIDSTKTDQDFLALILGDVDGNWNPDDFKADSTSVPIFHVMIPGKKIRKGHVKLLLPLIVREDLTDQHIASYMAELNWDPNILANPQVRHQGTLTEFWGSTNYFQNKEKSGKLIFGQFSELFELQGSGILLNLSFDILKDVDNLSAVELKFCMLNNVVATIIGESPASSSLLSIDTSRSNHALQSHGTMTSNHDSEYPSNSIEQIKEGNESLTLSSHPNPFNQNTVIRISLPETEALSLVIYNPLGQLIKVLARGVFPGGSHEFFWDGTDEAGMQPGSGLYLCHFRTAQSNQIVKMLLLK